MILPDGTTLTNPSDVELTRATGSSVEPEDDGDRPADRRRRARGAVGCRLRRVRGAPHARRRHARDRGTGPVELADPELPRAFPRGVSGAVLARQAYEQAWVFGARFAFMQHVTALRADADRLVATLSEGRPSRRARSSSPPASRIAASESPRSRPSPARASSTAARAPTRIGWRARTSTWSAGRTPPGRLRSTSRGTRGASRSSCGRRRSRRGCRTTSSGSSRRRRTSRSGSAPRSSEEEATAGSRTSSCATGRAVPRRRCPRTGSTSRSGPARTPTGSLPRSRATSRGFVLTGADVPRDAWPLERDPLPLETSMPRVLAVGDARHGSVKRVASAVGAGSIAIQVVHRLLEDDDATAPVDELARAAPGLIPAGSPTGRGRR